MGLNRGNGRLNLRFSIKKLLPFSREGGLIGQEDFNHSKEISTNQDGRVHNGPAATPPEEGNL